MLNYLKTNFLFIPNINKPKLPKYIKLDYQLIIPKYL